MSILNALKQHDGSIDELAKLPQNLIMQMAQRKEIGAEMVAPILARKAQMADAVARTKALQKGTGQVPTVMEQLMQKTAEHEQPEPQQHEMGIAANPIPERNYAGGGIVAFAEAGPVEDKNLPERLPGESDNAYMQRVQALTGAGKQFFTPRNYNPLAKLSDLYNTYQENIGQPFAAGIKSFVNESPESQAARFNAAKQQPTKAAAPTTTNLPPAPTGVKTDELGRADAAKQGNKSAGTTDTKATGLKALTNKPNIGDAEPKTPSELQQILAQYRSDIEGSKDEKDKARKEAMWSRLLEAGLNVMGGQSSNFAQNLALAGPAAKGFGEDIKGLRAEETAKRKQLAELGLKGYELSQAAKKQAAEEKYMGQHGKYFEQAGQAAITSANRPTAGAYGAERVDVAATKELLAAAQKQLLSAKKAERPAIQQQIDTYNKRLEALAGIGGAPAAASVSGAFNYVPGKGLVPVQ
jgi:hypothetical protein